MILELEKVVHLCHKSVPLVSCINGVLKKNKQPQIRSEVFFIS